MRAVIVVVGLLLSVSGPALAQETKKPLPKPPPPAVLELLKSTPEEFLKRWDKNGDGALSKDELPPFLAQAFEKLDKDGNGKLDRQEVAAMAQLYRGMF